MAGSNRDFPPNIPFVENETQAVEALNQGLVQLPWDRDLEPGEKAEDAVDYEDVSDNDLPDDLPDPQAFPQPTTLPDSRNGAQHGDDDLDDSAATWNRTTNEDLFGDDGDVPLAEVSQSFDATLATSSDPLNAIAIDHESLPKGHSSLGHASSSALQMQRRLFAQSRASFGNENLPEPPETDQEFLAALWPNFEKRMIPNFMDLLPPKKARYMAKEISRPPRALNPTKLGLDIERDQEKTFKAPAELKKGPWQDENKSGLIAIVTGHDGEDSSGESIDQTSESSLGEHSDFVLQDLQMLCEDWDPSSGGDSDGAVGEAGAWMNGTTKPSTVFEGDKSAFTIETPSVSFLDLPRMQDPEYTTAHIAKRVKLDLNDPSLLVDAPSLASANSPYMLSRDQSAIRGRKNLNLRYNISNDQAYNLLKENHLNKVRQTLGNLQVDHSMPALRLQWPFFKTRLDKREARSFHRNPLKTDRDPVSFSKSVTIKKKHTKGRDAQTLFAQSSDLSLNDNSNILLLEYSEEHPTMLSNLGMASKLVNHYRKRNAEDNIRPKREVGELNVLLPQDKSPLSLFGHIDPGQVTSAIHNSMYRAPVFPHVAKDTDFLVTKTTTGINGSSWYLRHVENLHVVGQQFPSVDVPGPHSRKVTTASKNRLRMISYRIARRSKSHRISVSEVTNHFIDSTDMQNRQKMKEFMQFDKDHKEWKMRPGESIPEEEAVRTMVKPEDVCLLESMQVGQQHLQDAGLSKDDDDDASEGEDSKEGETIEQQLAPWFTSRNFLNASQGKAMLQLHGDGDPSGRGEALSLLKTSMKGGFRAIGESVADKIKKKDLKEKNSRQYNVNEQQLAYEDFIRRVWDAQKRSLSSVVEHSDSEIDEDNGDTNPLAQEPDVPLRSDRRSLGSVHRQDDESASQSTKWSTNSQNDKILEIVRIERNRWGEDEEVRDICRNPRIIRQYMRRRRALATANEEILDLKPSDDPEENRRRQQRLQKEHDRLVRNKERRIAREKQKGVPTDGTTEVDGPPLSPSSTAPVKSGATQRKCANCGMTGHIKTNKKLCPMLNGTRKPEEGFSTSAFTSGAPAL